MGLYSKHVVEIETIFTVKGDKKIPKSEKTIESLGRGITKTTQVMHKYDKKGKEIVTTTEKNVKGFQRFQMEHLGVMFAGMALNRAMANLNATSREWLGIGELTSTMMGITMLDANMDLLQYGVLPLFDALTNLPPEAQKSIGLTTIAFEGLGGVLMVGGQLALGVASILIILEKIGGVGGAAAGVRTALLGLAGISIIGIGITLGIAALTTEGGESILYALGSALAIAVGAPLVGVSIATGIALGAITITAILLWKYVDKLAEESKAYKTLAGAAPGGVTDVLLPGIHPSLQERWTRTTIPNLPEGWGGPQTPGGVNMNVNYQVTVSDKREFESLLKKYNNDLTEMVRRSIKV